MDEEILDLNEFLERVQNDKELLLELLDIFVADFQEKQTLLKKAVADKDYEQIRYLAHSLKGASGNISAKSLRQIFLKLEGFGKNNDVTGAENLLDNIDTEFRRLKDRIASLKVELKK